MSKELTLTQALAKIDELEKLRKERNSDYHESIRGKFYRGEDLKLISANRAAYLYATHQTMKHTLFAEFKELGFDMKEHLFDWISSQCLPENGELLLGVIINFYEDDLTCTQLAELEEYVSTFSPEEHRALKRKKSIEQLAKLKLI